MASDSVVGSSLRAASSVCAHPLPRRQSSKLVQQTSTQRILWVKKKQARIWLLWSCDISGLLLTQKKEKSVQAGRNGRKRKGETERGRREVRGRERRRRERRARSELRNAHA